MLVHRSPRSGIDARVVVTEQDRAERRVEVDELVPVDVADARPLRLRHEQRIRPGAAPLTLDATRRDAACALMERGRRVGRDRPIQRRLQPRTAVDGRHAVSAWATDAGRTTAVRAPLTAEA